MTATMTKEQQLAVLDGMLELLSDRECWTQRQFAPGFTNAIPTQRAKEFGAAGSYCVVGGLLKVELDQGLLPNPSSLLGLSEDLSYDPVYQALIRSGAARCWSCCG